MAITRRDFIKIICLIGGALLLKACKQADKPKGDFESWQPAYLKLETEGKLAERVEQAYAIFEKCELCPSRCGVNRLEGQLGFCNAPEKAMVYSHHPHFGEELPLVGLRGSGTIFFSNCNLRCVFCQNWPTSHEGLGNEVSDEASRYNFFRCPGLS